jgi:hypothetical protein
MKHQSHNRLLLKIIVILILSIAYTAVASAADSLTPMPLQQASQKVLSTLRQPPANGVLVASVELPAELVQSGLQPGDIIMRAGGKNISTPADLNAAFSSANTLSLTIARAQIDLTLNIPSSVTNLDLMGVIAGMPAPLNPPATPRKDFDLLWNQVPTLSPQPGQAVGHDMWFLVFVGQNACGALHLTIPNINPGALVWNFQALRNGPLPAQAWAIDFFAGDNHSSLPFELLGADWWLNNTRIIMGQSPNGRELSVTTNGPQNIQNFETLPGAIPTPALPLLAAALPHKPGIVLPVVEITPQNLATQPGCVLQTFGMDKISIGGTTQSAWKVQLLRYDIPQYTFWFDSDGSLLMMDLGGDISAIQVSGQGAIKKIFPPGSLQDVMPALPQTNL